MKYFLLIIFSSALLNSSAQNFESESFSFKGSVSPLKDSIKSSINNIEARFNYVIANGKKSIVMLGAGYEQYWQANSFLPNATSLKGLSLQMAYRHRISSSKSYSITLRPGLYSEFESIDINDLRFSVAFHYSIKKQNGGGYGYGIALSQQFYGLLLNPFFDIQLKLKSDKLALKGALPLAPQLEYKASNSWRFGFGLKSQNNSFRLNDANYYHKYIQIREWDLHSYATKKLSSLFSLTGSIGYAFKRNYSIYNADDKVPLSIFNISIGSNKRTALQSFDKKGMIFQIGISMRLKTQGIN